MLLNELSFEHLLSEGVPLAGAKASLLQMHSKASVMSSTVMVAIVPSPTTPH